MEKEHIFSKPDIGITFNCTQSINFAMQQHSVNLLKSFSVTNHSEIIMENIRIKIYSQPCFFGEIFLNIQSLSGGETNFTDKITPVFDYDFLSSLTERINADILIDIEINEAHLKTETSKIKLLAFDEWHGYGYMPELLASFCIPADPAVKAVISEAAQLLKEENLSFDGYQSSNPNVVNKQLAAIYSVIKSRNIAYSMPPASFEVQGQKIRLPKNILDSGLATCLDSTMLFCSCAEAVGINPIIFLVKGHAFPGFWLIENMSRESVNSDLSEIKKRQGGGLNQICALESTVVTDLKSNFSLAVSIAKDRINDGRDFLMYLDIARARRGGILPLPLRFEENGSYYIDRKTYNPEKEKLKELKVVDADLKGQGLGDRFDKWKRDLLDISLRNPLINYKINKAGIPLLNNDLEMIEDSFAQGASFQILPRPKEIIGAVNLANLNIAGDDAVKEILNTELSALKLRCAYNAEELPKKLTEIFRLFKQSLEENGANILYLALGFLKWQEADKPNTDRYAPVILLPLEIERKSVRTGYSVKMVDEGAKINLSLLELLRVNFKIDASGLLALPEGESGTDVLKVMTFLRKLILNQKGWDIIDAASIGLFKYSSFMLWHDLTQREDIIRAHPLTGSLITMKNNPVLYEEKEEQEGPLYLPLDSDSSQTNAVRAAARGDTFVLHGPPGTGKSQTITNIIANALAHGKKVLFVAEKNAALNVVKKRLEKLGLFDFCLELHSDKNNKKSFYDQFDNILNISEKVRDVNFKEAEDKLNETAAEIESFNTAMQAKRKIGFSVYEGINKLLGAENVDDELIKVNYTEIDEGEYQEGLDNFKKAVSLGSALGEPVNSSFYGIEVKEFSLKLKDDMSALAKDLSDNFDSFNESIKMASSELNGKEFNKYSEIQDLFRSLRGYSEHIKKSALSRFFANLASKKYRSVKKIKIFKDIKKLIKEKPDLAEVILSGLEKFVNKEKELNSLLLYGDKFNGSGEWAFDIYHAAEQFRQDASFLRDYCIYNEYRYKCAEYKALSEITALYHEGKTDSGTVVKLFIKSFLSSWLNSVVSKEKVLSAFSQNEYSTKREQYIKMAQFVSSLTQKEIYLKMASQVPNFKYASTSSSEPGILLKAIKSKGRGLNIRQLFAKTTNLMPKIKPCMLMSPLSAAQFLPADYPKFDIVVFDEASQILTCDAVGAITRGESAVIVGDPNQLPPTTFFAVQQKEEDEELEEMDLESILDDLLTLNVKECRLLWHYRSEHESLIAFSNINNYENKLITFPSVDDNKSRVSFRKIEGFYDRGTTRTNLKEAEAIVDELISSLQDLEKSKLSYGIITFNVTQQNLIQDMIDKRLAKEPFLEKFFTGDNAVFVKNIENVQGDERDVILFSITYGEDKDGKMTLNFGPVNKEGGWRRLNVAVTRACKQMIVFSTITPDKIDVSKTSARGVHALKDFMSFAQNSRAYFSRIKNTAGGCPLITEVSKTLNKSGYAATVNLGSSENKIDIAVSGEDASYKLGIICNGENAIKNSDIRDREYGKENVLKRMGWNLTRLYALEWWQDSEKELKRLKNLLENNSAEKQAEEINPADEFIQEHKEVMFNPQIPLPEIEYVKAEFNQNTQDKFYVNSPEVINQIQKLIKTEAPIAEQTLYKRIAETWQIPKMSQKYNEYLANLIKRVPHFNNKTQNTVFLWNSKDEPDMKVFRSNSVINRKADEISKEEFSVAVYYIMQNALSIDIEDLIRETAKLFGFIKSPSTAARISYAVSMLSAQGRIKKDGSICRLN